MKAPGEKLFDALRDNVGSNASIYELWNDCPIALRMKFAAAEREVCGVIADRDDPTKTELVDEIMALL